jgi:hypothetical protein
MTTISWSAKSPGHLLQRGNQRGLTLENAGTTDKLAILYATLDARDFDDGTAVRGQVAFQ